MICKHCGATIYYSTEGKEWTSMKDFPNLCHFPPDTQKHAPNALGTADEENKEPDHR